MGASLWNVGGGVLSLSVVVSLGGGVDIVGGGRGVSLGGGVLSLSWGYRWVEVYCRWG